MGIGILKKIKTHKEGTISYDHETGEIEETFGAKIMRPYRGSINEIYNANGEELIKNGNFAIQGDKVRELSFDTFCDSGYLENNLLQNVKAVFKNFYIGDKKKITIDRKGRFKGGCNITLILRETTINELDNLTDFELHVTQEDVDNNFEIIKNDFIRNKAINGELKVVVADVQ